MSALLRRIVVIGASGQLGSDLMAELWDLHPTAIDHATLDIERADDVAAMFAEHDPSLVINTAAYHNVERCEAHAERAFAVNAVAVDGLAALCQKSGVALAHISTDYVFDGSAREPYPETGLPNPLNVYGISKYAGELCIANRIERAFIFRTSGLYGVRGSSTKGHTFVERIREQADAGTPIRVVNDVTTTPSYTRHVARTMRAVLETGRFGTYHVTSGDSCTWYEFAREIVRSLGVSADLEAVTRDTFPSPVRRPAYSVLANTALTLAGVAPAPHWRDGLAAYLEARNA